VKNYYNKEYKANYNDTEIIDKNVRRLLAKNPSPFTFYGTGTYIIGEEEIAIVDPGPIIESHVSNLLKIIQDANKVHLFITHTHADHSPAAKILKEKKKCITYGYGPYKRKSFDTEFEEGHDLTFIPDIYLKDGDIIKGKNWTIRSIHTPGHTSNHMCFGLEENSILFTGDHIMGWSTTVIIPPDGNMDSYIDSLKKVLKYNYKTFYPTHGGPIKKTRQFVKALIAHRLMRQNQITSELSKNSLTLEQMVSKFYKTTDKRLWPAAQKSILANLLSLKSKGIVIDENEKKPRWKLT
jgi:glyoxylase-like metal-dependent hydrolase (beta-lactamase superfamily II)